MSTYYDLRDRTPGYGQVTMGSEDRTALALAADRERDRIWRGPWYERAWGRASIVLGLAVGIANVIATVWHR